MNSKEQIDDLANRLLSSEIDDLSGDDDPVDLTPDEERDADDMMAVAATMGVIQNELNALEILIVKDDLVYNESIEKKFIQNWRDRIGTEMSFTITYVDG